MACSKATSASVVLRSLVSDVDTAAASALFASLESKGLGVVAGINLGIGLTPLEGMCHRSALHHQVATRSLVQSRRAQDLILSGLEALVVSLVRDPDPEDQGKATGSYQEIRTGTMSDPQGM